MTRLNSYLLFDSTCKEAMDFYKSVFGGERVLIPIRSGYVVYGGTLG
jgi:uncharacterized glyoxalase superfamily protein PhnB